VIIEIIEGVSDNYPMPAPAIENPQSCIAEAAARQIL
jgi:hypothetical protein